MIISRKTAQQIVDTVKDVCGYDINFINEHGTIFASTNTERIGSFHEIGKQVIASGQTIEVTESDTYSGTHPGVNVPIFHNGLLIAVIGISGIPEEVRKFAYLAEKITLLLIREQELNVSARTLNDKKAFLLRSLLNDDPIQQDSMLPLLHEFQLDTETQKRVLILRITSHQSTWNMNISALSFQIRQLFEQLPATLFCFQYPNEYIALLDADISKPTLNRLRDFTETYAEHISIGIGRPSRIFQLKASHDTAEIALNSLANTPGNFALYDKLTLDLILGTLTQDSRNTYLKRTLSKLVEKDIDLLRIYFENGCFLTRTCEKLSLHKNTLQYKLDRISRICGYNPREFKDAVVLYLAIRLYDSEPETIR